MQPLTVYGIKTCDSCRKAIKWLEGRDIEAVLVDIGKHPPDAAVLAVALREGGYELKHLFNTSGRAYREPGTKEKLAAMGPDEALDFLAERGMLIKRPIVTDGRRITVGFREPIFTEVWG